MQSEGQLAAKDLGELQVFLAEGVGLRTLHVESADDLVAPLQRNRQRTTGAFSALDIEWIGGGIGAEIALAGGGHLAGDAVVLLPGEQLALGCRRGHAFGQEGNEPAAGTLM